MILKNYYKIKNKYIKKNYITVKILKKNIYYFILF